MNLQAATSVIDRNNQLLASAEEHVYKETDDGLELKAHVFVPENDPPEGQGRPAMLFFFSSLWDHGMIAQFAPQCLHFSGRGAVCALIEYRTSTKHQTTPMEAISDARSALRWIRYNAEALEVDAHRIIACGGSAGAHIALAAAMIPSIADDPSDPKISCVPDALVLFTPIVNTTKKKGIGSERFPSASDANSASPSKHIRKRLPPMIMFHGTGDRIVPFESTARFAKTMQRKKNVCELVVFEGRGNSFYNFNVDADCYESTLNAADRFLVDQGFLPESEEDDGDAVG